MTIPLLTSVGCTHHVHLIIGDNGIAAKRVTRSVEAGADCVLITPTTSKELHFDLRAVVDKGVVEHVKREFEEGDLRRFGRTEVDGVVDMVFVTLSPLDKRGEQPNEKG
jgi:siroheme synthase (precorrin-2 oxidase/ferrochelatase)